ncbi:hypothetical protein BJ742DRAFT_794169 [Cladochytrium replicatum]|nr:hypothetical protein BJ742DRAFT_794169 [Cladochytrium replicatum]
MPGRDRPTVTKRMGPTTAEGLLWGIAALASLYSSMGNGNWQAGIGLISLFIAAFQLRDSRRLPPGTTFDDYRIECSSGLLAGSLTIPFVLISLINAVESNDSRELLLLYFWSSVLLSSTTMVVSSVPKSWQSAWLTIFGLSILATFVARIRPIPSSSSASAIWWGSCALVYLGVLQTLVRLVRKTFSLGEGMIISEAMALLLVDSIIHTTSELQLVHWGVGDVQRSHQFVLMTTLVIGMLLCGPVLFTTVRYMRGQISLPSPQSTVAKGNGSTAHAFVPKPVSPHELRTTIAFFSVFFAIVGGVLLRWNTLRMPGHENGFLWTIFFIFEELPRSMIVVLWVVMVLCAILAASWLWPLGVSASDAKGLNMRRKFYHLLATAMFVPGIVVDAEFSHLAFSFALSAFIMVEYIRLLDIQPFGQYVHFFYQSYLDTRDAGLVIVSHLYLLIGCASPVWMSSLVKSSAVAALTGIFVLGIGDTAASVGGKLFGRRRWPASNKTVEGTLCFVGAVVVFMFLLSLVGVVQLTAFQWLKFTIIATGSALMEAVSDQNDNLMLPPFTAALMLLHL